MHESLVITPSEDHVIPLRESFIELCGGDRNAAYLLSVLEFWTNHHHRENQIKKRLNDERARRGIDEEDHYELNESLWVQRTREEISQDALGLLNKNSITASANKLEDMGLIETGHPRRSEGDNRKYYRLRIDKLNDALRSIVIQDQEKDRWREEETQEREEKRRRKEDPDTDTDEWTEGDWQYRYAQRWWEWMDDLGNGRINYTWRKKKEDLMQKWADAFDWCIRNGGVTKDELDDIIHWLFHVDDFWIPEGALVAPTKFKKKNGQDQWRLHEWKTKMQVWKSKDDDEGFELPDPGEEVGEWRKDRIVEHHPEAADDFYSVGYESGGDSKIFKYQPST